MIDVISQYPVLTVLTFWPTLAAILLALTKSERATRVWTLVASLVEVGLAYPLLAFQKTSSFQFLEQWAWAPDWGLTYSLGVDGVSILMIWLSILTLPVCVLCSWTYIGRRVKEFHVCLLLMTTACVGVFSALDLVLFYVFWEALLIPMYLMIAIWGGDERRYASIKFFLYTLAGSTLLLVAIVALRIEAHTFYIPDLMNTNFSFNFQYWIFLAFFIAFAIKVPMFPFHTWLPAAHVQAPAAGSVILAAVLLKMGTYGFLRFSLPLAPAASQYFAPLMIVISIISILYGGAIALGQTDIKKLIAYSSVAHMGFVTLGIFLFNQFGIQGAIFQMLNHGIITGAMFTLIGAVYERSHSRDIAKNLGLGKYLPAFMFFWGFFGLASFGFPGTNGFVGEFLVIVAAFQKDLTTGLLVIPGALLAAAYILKVTLKLAWGQPASPAGKNWLDLKKKEWAYLIVPAFLVVYLGLAPTGLLEIITPSVDGVIASYESRKDLHKPTDFVVESLSPVKARPNQEKTAAEKPASGDPASQEPANQSPASQDPGSSPAARPESSLQPSPELSPATWAFETMLLEDYQALDRLFSQRLPETENEAEKEANLLSIQASCPSMLKDGVSYFVCALNDNTSDNTDANIGENKIAPEVAESLISSFIEALSATPGDPSLSLSCLKVVANPTETIACRVNPIAKRDTVEPSAPSDEKPKAPNENPQDENSKAGNSSDSLSENAIREDSLWAYSLAQVALAQVALAQVALANYDLLGDLQNRNEPAPTSQRFNLAARLDSQAFYSQAFYHQSFYPIAFYPNSPAPRSFGGSQ